MPGQCRTPPPWGYGWNRCVPNEESVHLGEATLLRCCIHHWQQSTRWLGILCFFLKNIRHTGNFLSHPTHPLWVSSRVPGILSSNQCHVPKYKIKYWRHAMRRPNLECKSMQNLNGRTSFPFLEIVVLLWTLHSITDLFFKCKERKIYFYCIAASSSLSTDILSPQK